MMHVQTMIYFLNNVMILGTVSDVAQHRNSLLILQHVVETDLLASRVLG